MAAKVGASPPSAHFDFELFEADPDMPATSNQIRPWIDPVALKLKHRIGRGPFGDVWLATHHHYTADYDEYHEVAVKILHSIKEDHIQVLLDKFEDIFFKCQGLQGVCWLHGISVISGKVCIVMKFYEGSVGDKMVRLKGGRLPLPDVLRFGIELAQGVLELHLKGNLLLNLKPHNFLLNVHDQAIVGDFGIPLLLLGIPLPNSNMELRLGTPNYMAPEQWQPEVRGPISFETDSWGFGCSVVEMVTGVQPWRGRSVAEMYHSVVIKQEKPHVPNGLPPAVENVLRGCFEYDLRNRPLITDVLHAFKRWEKSGFEANLACLATKAAFGSLIRIKPLADLGLHSQWDAARNCSTNGRVEVAGRMNRVNLFPRQGGELLTELERVGISANNPCNTQMPI
ncbi:hypothetical protein GIB67_030546 [Kingdonia uniflora]|uniref:Protein kinase domain-containing protein n=1 Tax=Kingdonia uniflora TaxID=39325 RepID=A0A7J7P2W1_9MAGN|nr:hypothetical protein GIB67_030546 [Kingdonia uniflora]